MLFVYSAKVIMSVAAYMHVIVQSSSISNSEEMLSASIAAECRIVL